MASSGKESKSFWAVCDFETTYSEDAEKGWVWLADICEPVEGGFQHTTVRGISEFLAELKKKGLGLAYFHNLKFDGSYILDYLLRHGWTDITPQEPKGPKEISLIITIENTWYSMTVTDSTGDFKIRFIDSLKKIPLSVKGIGEVYGHDTKGEIDYKLPRPEGYIATKSEIDYVRRDTEIVCDALAKHLSYGLDKDTIASDAFSELRKTVENKGFTILGFKFFRDHPDIERFCRKSYKGGLCYVNPFIQEKEVGPGIVLDVNSLYPYVMSTKRYPIFAPKRMLKGEAPPGSLWIAEFNVSLEKKAGHLPFLRPHDDWVTTTYEGPVVITSVDYELICESYTGKIEFKSGLIWPHSSSTIFRDYVTHWYAAKQAHQGGRRMIDKLMLNSAYGKFGSRRENFLKHAYLDGDQVKFRVIEANDRAIFNIAIASFVTAYGRAHLNACFKKSKGFVYCDTDSLHLATIEGIPPEYHGDIDVARIGAMKKESSFTRARYLRQKTYIEDNDGHLVVRACGLPESAKKHVTWENFKIGAKYAGKLRMKLKRGGYQLEESDFIVHDTNHYFSY